MAAKKFLLAGAAVAALSIGMAAPAMAAESTGPTSYQATLNPVAMNTPDGAASGTVTVKIDGNKATVTEKVKGLATKLPKDKDTLKTLGIPDSFAGAAFPHVQHIHIDGNHQCPGPDADANGDGLITTAEGVPAYGKVGTTLSLKGSTAASAATDVTVAPGGGSYTYERTFTLNDATMKSIENNTAAVVVHGLNPETAPKASLSTANSLDVTLPGQDKKVAAIATAPALCGTLNAMQMNGVPAGSADTGGGSAAASDGNMSELALGGLALLLAAGMGVVALRRRRPSES